MTDNTDTQTPPGLSDGISLSNVLLAVESGYGQEVVEVSVSRMSAHIAPDSEQAIFFDLPSDYTSKDFKPKMVEAGYSYKPFLTFLTADLQTLPLEVEQRLNFLVLDITREDAVRIGAELGLDCIAWGKGGEWIIVATTDNSIVESFTVSPSHPGVSLFCNPAYFSEPDLFFASICTLPQTFIEALGFNKCLQDIPTKPTGECD